MSNVVVARLLMVSILTWMMSSFAFTGVAAFCTPPIPTTTVLRTTTTTTQLHFNIPSLIQNWGKTVKASHILITTADGGGLEAGISATNKSGRSMSTKEQAIAKLEELKEEIDNDPIKFAEAAKEYSCCPSSARGGDMGEVGPGKMVGNFDRVSFNEAVGKVHGPIWTPYGYHLIYIAERSE